MQRNWIIGVVILALAGVGYGLYVLTSPGSMIEAFTAEPREVEMGKEAIFNVSAVPKEGRTIVAYTLTFGDGEEISEADLALEALSQTFTYVYAAAGTYTATLEVVDDLGQTATKSLEIVVVAPAG
jgi:PKD repeat protein